MPARCVVIEGLISTWTEDGDVHVAVMGPRLFADDPTRLEIRPFLPSRTWDRLAASGRGVFHVTDRTDQMVDLVVGEGSVDWSWRPWKERDWAVVDGACHWWPFEVVEARAEERPRARLVCRKPAEPVVVRPFVGFHRARHAILEAAIAATRIAHLPARHILETLDHVRPWVEKTGGPDEADQFARLEAFIRRRLRIA